MKEPGKRGRYILLPIISLIAVSALLTAFSQIDLIPVRAAVMTALLLFHSAVMLFSLRRRNGAEFLKRRADGSPDEETAEPVGTLIPMEDESDLGELIEVDDRENGIAVAVHYEPEEPVSMLFPVAESLLNNENLEELEACEDSVEELEAVDE